MTKTIHNEEYYNSSGAKDPTAGQAIRNLDKNNHRFFIHGKLPGLNEYVNANRSSKYKGGSLKKETDNLIIVEIKNQLKNTRIKQPVFIKYTWIETNKMRDKDNISFAKKFINDALVKSGTLKDDGWGQVAGFSDAFVVNAENPGVLVELFERLA